MSKLGTKETQLSSVLRFFDKSVEFFAKAGLVRIGIWTANFRFLLIGSTAKFAAVSGSQKFTITEGHLNAHFSSWRRGSHIYRRGLSNRLRQVSQAYCLDSLIFESPRIRVVDCGANYGDFSRAVLEKFPLAKLDIIEPVPWDAETLRTRFPTHKVYEFAAASANGVATFFLSEAGGDSSLFVPRNSSRPIQVKTRTLDELLDDGAIDLLKIEAEGAEPEVLLGALNVLDRTSFVVIDGGPERGSDPHPTLLECSQILTSKGFVKVADSNERKDTALFSRLASISKVS